jgi:type II secretory pathway pseudopilin PulG
MRARARQRAVRRALDPSGFTIVEVVVAVVILILSGLAVLALIDAANRNNFRAEQSQVVNNRLQQEMEKIKGLPYFQVALTGLPTGTGDPNSRVSGTQFNVNRDGSSNYEELIRNGGRAPSVAQGSDNSLVAGGTVAPGPTPFDTGNITGKIYRYITWQQASSCSNCPVKWYRHVTVAITLDNTASGGTRIYQEIQGDVANPNAGLPASQGGPGADGPGEGGGGGGTGGGGGGSGPGPGDNTETPWTFWLTDTPCSPDPPAETRLPITGNHDTHNTMGGCPAGMVTGPGAGAPDLMFTRAAALNPDFPADQQPLYDYATDVEPTTNPDQDKGLQQKTPPDPLHLQCTVDVTSLPDLQRLGSDPATATPRLYVHKWLSPPIPAGFSDVVLDGTGELDLWTQTIGGASYPGKICVWLFVRTGIDARAVNLDLSAHPLYFTYSQSSWPSNSWTEIHLPLHFAAVDATGATSPVHLPAGSRLGLGIGTAAPDSTKSPPDPGTGGPGLQFMYDAPSFDSRLRVDTRSLLPIF